MPSGPVNARGERAKGECAIGAVTKGIKDGQEVSYYTWIQLNYEETFKKHGHSATAYSVGVPLATATMLYAQGNIRRKGAFPPEMLDPGPWPAILKKYGMPMHTVEQRRY